jgi:hypothetical protein
MKNDDKTEENDAVARAEAARRGSPFLNTAHAAYYLGISIRTLEELNEHGEGPPFRKHGRQKRFHIVELETWSNARKRSRSRRRSKSHAES